MNEKKHWEWLENKLQIWQSKGILAKEITDKILIEKPCFKEEYSLLTRILISISALLFGLSVISFFAFNWAYMPKILKLTVLFMSFVSSNVAALIFDVKYNKKNMAEFFYLLGTFLFGANIMLIAQIYHIEEHAPNGVFLWSIGAIMMAYILNSSPQFLIYGILTVIWQCMKRDFDLPQYWTVASTALIMLPFSFTNKHLFSVTISAVTLFAVFFIQMTYFAIGFTGNLFFLSVLYLGLGVLIRDIKLSKLALPFERVGYIVYFITIFILTFKGSVRRELLDFTRTINESSQFLPYALTALTLIIWSAYFFPLNLFFEKFKQMERKHIFMSLIAFLFAAFIWSISNYNIKFLNKQTLPIIGMIGFNIIAFLHGFFLLYSGTLSGRVMKSFIGCLLVVSIIFARFAEYSADLLMRSFAFLLAGAFILYIAIKTSKIKKQNKL